MTLDNLCIQRSSSVSHSACPDLVSGGERIKLKINIVNSSNLAGLVRGHLFKCLVTVVSLLCWRS